MAKLNIIGDIELAPDVQEVSPEVLPNFADKEDLKIVHQNMSQLGDNISNVKAQFEKQYEQLHKNNEDLQSKRNYDKKEIMNEQKLVVGRIEQLTNKVEDHKNALSQDIVETRMRMSELTRPKVEQIVHHKDHDDEIKDLREVDEALSESLKAQYKMNQKTTKAMIKEIKNLKLRTNILLALVVIVGALHLL